MGLRTGGVAGKYPKVRGRLEEPAGRNARPYLAYAKRGQHRTVGGDVVLHEGFERFGEAVNRLRRFKSEALGQLPIRRGNSPPGLIDERLAKTVLQDALRSSSSSGGRHLH